MLMETPYPEYDQNWLKAYNQDTKIHLITVIIKHFLENSLLGSLTLVLSPWSLLSCADFPIG